MNQKQLRIWTFFTQRLNLSNPLLLKIANKILISIHDMLQMCLFGNLVVIFILVSSNKLRKIVRSICGSKDVAMKICYK